MRRLFSVAAIAVAVGATAFLAALVQASPALADDDNGGSEEKVVCTGSMTGRIDADVIVPTGAVCVLTDARVEGDVVVEPSAQLNALKTIVEGDIDCSGGFTPPAGFYFCALLSETVVEGNGIVRAGGELHVHGGHILGNVRAGPGSVFFTTPPLPNLPPTNSHIGGNVRCNGCTFLDLAETTVGGSVHIKGEAEGSFIAENSEIGGDVEILKSEAGPFAVVIAGNTIHGDVEFTKNVGPTEIVRNIIGGDLEIRENNVAGVFCEEDFPGTPCPPGIENGYFADNQVGGGMEVLGTRARRRSRTT